MWEQIARAEQQVARIAASNLSKEGKWMAAVLACGPGAALSHGVRRPPVVPHLEADRRRDRELQARGFVVLRFTYREVIETPEVVAASLRVHLS